MLKIPDVANPTVIAILCPFVKLKVSLIFFLQLQKKKRKEKIHWRVY